MQSLRVATDLHARMQACDAMDESVEKVQCF
jgi:hypothetical protein